MSEDELIPYSTPTTLLQAVNACLRAIGESPVSTLVNGGASVDVEAAHQCVQEASRETQAEGWSWNTDIRYPVKPDTSGHLILPSNTLRATPSGTSQYLDVVVRGGKLYDRTNHTDVFTDIVYVDLQVLLPFEDLPEPARSYITIRAARKFADDQLGSGDVHRIRKEDEDKARACLEQAEVEDDGTTLKDSPMFNSWISGRRAGRVYG